jgi:NADH-quinone oxidoreductase subunit E
VNVLLQHYPDEIANILEKYPADQKRSAVMPLLHLAQREAGFINRQAILDIAEIVEVTTTDVASLIGFYTLFHDKEGGRYRFQVCTDLSCALRGADHFVGQLCKNLGIQVGETTADGLISVEEVTCLAGCDHGPVFQVQGDGEINYHEDQTIETAMKLVEELRKHANS